MKHAAASLALGCLSLFLFGHELRAAEPARRPNVIIIAADDLGYGEPGCLGGKDIPTPNIDALAKNGILFTNGYVTAPFCAASRAGFLTGRYQTRFGFEFNPIGPRNEDPHIGLPVRERTLGDLLRNSGYATSLVGKWHLGGTADFHPQRRGFDEFFGFLHEGHFYVPPPWQHTTTWLRRTALPDGGKGRWTAPDGKIIWSTHMNHREPDYDADNPLLRNSQPVDEKEYLADAFTREAESFIDRHKDQPFFLYLAYNSVHSPLQAKDVDLKRFGHIKDIQRRIFAAMLANLDDNVGRVMKKLRQHDLEEDTLVVFLSDNGGPTRELTSSNKPLRGEKGQLYEGGIRIPFIVQWKGKLPAGKVDDRPIVSLDIAPTALAAAGVAVPKNLDGVNLLPFLTGSNKAKPHERLYWRVGAKAALRSGDWKLVRERGTWQLFNLKDDIGESQDLAGKQPERVRELERQWQAIDKTMIDPLWGGKKR